MKLFIQIFLIILVSNLNSYSGESGDLPEQEINKNSEIFNAVIGGLGSFGIILEVTMKLKQIK